MARSRFTIAGSGDHPLHPRAIVRRRPQFVSILAVAVLIGVMFGHVCAVLATNLVSVESKGVMTSQVACSVGVFVSNDIAISALILPLELRSASGGAYIRTGSPGSFWFGVVPGNRLDASPLGSSGPNWPEAIRATQYFAAPSVTNSCSGPESHTYSVQTASVDGQSPDAVFHAALSTGDPNIGEEWLLAPGSDVPGTANASLMIVFNVDSLNGCICIDTCCRAPANHLEMVDGNMDANSIVPEFIPGMISVGGADCVVETNLHPPTAVCKDSVLVGIGNECLASLYPREADGGSWDAEDGTDLTFALDPPGPYPFGETSVSLSVYDQGGRSSSCETKVIVIYTDPEFAQFVPDSVYFHVGADSVFSPTCQSPAIIGGGCTPEWSMVHEDGLLIDVWGPSGSPPELEICLNQLFSNNSVNGVYSSLVVIDDRGRRDTLHVIVTIDQPPGAPEPRCDSICGFVRSIMGEGLSGAIVNAYTCDSAGVNCELIPGSIDTTDVDGAFCINVQKLRHVGINVFADTLHTLDLLDADCLPETGNHRPIAICRDSLVIPMGSGCLATVTADQLDMGSWDEEDGTDLIRYLAPAGPFSIGEHSVRLVVCDKGGKCTYCTTRIIVQPDLSETIVASPDQLYLVASQTPGLSHTSDHAAITVTGACAPRLGIREMNNLILDATIGGYQTPWTMTVSIDPILARYGWGHYMTPIVIEDYNTGVRDTVLISVYVERPAPEPCNTVCGRIVTESGSPVSGAFVGIIVSDSLGRTWSGSNGIIDTTDLNGDYCLEVGGVSGSTLFASAGDYPNHMSYGSVRLDICPTMPVYIYLKRFSQLGVEQWWNALQSWNPWTGGSESGDGGQGGGGGFPPPPCGNSGFVVQMVGVDSLLPIEGATVESWYSYPTGNRDNTATTDDNGHFRILHYASTFVVRAAGYCPEVIYNVTCSETPMIVALEPIGFAPQPNWPYFCDYYSSDANFVAEGSNYLIQPGDVIHATDPQGVVCGITSVSPDSSGTYLIHVLGDDPETPVDEGAEPGDAITLWLNCECDVVAPQTWVNFGNFQFDALWDCEIVPLCCVLCEGWNMWSHNIALSSYARPDVLATIDLSYDAVRSGLCDYGSISWFAGRPINDLDNVSPWFGYDIHMLQEDTVCLEGEPVDPSTLINLCAGWNYIPYLPESADNLAHALQSLDGNISHIFTMYCDYGVVSWNASRDPQNNDLNCMESCKGYWIEMTRDDTLVYPEPEVCDPLAKLGTRAIARRVTATPLVADYFAPSSTIAEGSVISARSSSGALIGETVVGAKGSFLIHVYGDVPFTPSVEGAVQGEVLTFEIDGVVAASDREIRWTDRDNQEIALSVGVMAAIPTEYTLQQNYPNPFNAGTVISFDLEDDAIWTLTIYNIMGQRVRDFTGQSAAGRIQVQWDGRSESGQQLASGVYFYRLSANEFTDFKKMMLVK